MLIQFSIENYKSFKDKAVLSMVASSDKSHESNLSVVGNSERVLNTIAIYGANAAGKTNLFKALATAIEMIRSSNKLQKTTTLDYIIPFLFDETSKEKSTSFEFVFMVENIKYVYGFSANTKAIVSEYLYAYYSFKPSTIFEREEDKYNFPKDKRMLDQLAEKNTPNKLFLSTATAWNYDKTEPVYNWFESSIKTFSRYEDMIKLSLAKLENEKQDGLHEFVIDLLHESDININDFEIESRAIEDEELQSTFGPFYQTIKDVQGFKGRKHSISLKHIVQESMEIDKAYTLNMSDESKGTENLFMFAPILFDALNNGSTLIIDEIERSLHPILVKYIISIFNSTQRNPKNAQLIFNTHNVELMSLDVFRRDQIYFVDKSTKTGISELYSLDEYSVRKEENIKKGYLLGRFGAIPSIVQED
ncbi:MAG: ATP-binding protein [Erysipelotrichaceae bacterium]|nr:ATP-binding protein [Erysipelotrichaceae bacterium]